MELFSLIEVKTMSNAVSKKTKLKRKFFRIEKISGLLQDGESLLSSIISLSPEHRNLNADEQAYLKSLKAAFNFVACKVEYEVGSNVRGIDRTDLKIAFVVINTLKQNMIKSKTIDQFEKISFSTTASRENITVLCDLEFNSDASLSSLEQFSRMFLRENFKKLKESSGKASSHIQHKMIAKKTTVTLLIEYALEQKKSVDNKIKEIKKVPSLGRGEKQW